MDGATYAKDSYTGGNVYGGWQNCTIDIALEDGTDAHSGHKSTVYTVKKDGAVYNSLENKTSSDPMYTLAESGEYTITVTTTDIVGNTTTADHIIQIDLIAPQLSVEPVKTYNSHSALKAEKSIDVTINLTDEGGSGIDWWIYDDEYLPAYLSESSSERSEGAISMTVDNNSTITLGTGLTGTYYLLVERFYDNASNLSQKIDTDALGNKSEYPDIVINNPEPVLDQRYHVFGPYVFDNSSPTITANPTSGEVEKKHNVTLTVAEVGPAGLINATTNTDSNVYEYYLSESNTSITDSTQKWTYTSGTTFTLEKDKAGNYLTGTYYLLVRTVKDVLNNESTLFGTVKTISGTKYMVFGPYVLDNATPEITFNPNSGGTTWKQEWSTQVTVVDRGDAGIKESSFRYLWLEEGATEPTKAIFNSTGTTFANGDTITIDEVTGKFNLWIYVEDNLGNSYVEKSELFFVDNTLPIVGDSLIAQLHYGGARHEDYIFDDPGTAIIEGWTKYDVYVSATAGSDEHSGHKITKCTIYKKNEFGLFEPITEAGAASVETILTETGEYKVEIITEDHAGNIASTGDSSIIRIDKENPTINETGGTRVDTMDLEVTKDNGTEVDYIGTWDAGKTLFTGKWTKQNVQIKLNDNIASDEHSGVYETRFTVKKDGAIYTTAAGQRLENITNTTQTYTLSHTGEYEIVLTVEDRAEVTYSVAYPTQHGTHVGNTITQTYKVYIDNTDPTAGTMITKLDSASGTTYNNNTWTKHKVYIQKVNGSDANSDHKETKYSVTYYSSVSRFNAGTHDSIDNSEPNLLTQDGIYAITVTTEDKSGIAYGEVGNTSTREYIVKIDGQDESIAKPIPGTMTMKLDNASGATYNNDTWTKHKVHLTLNNGSDLLSGHKETKYSVTYYSTLADFNAKTNGTVDNTQPNTLSRDGIYEITVTTEDNAGTEYGEIGNTEIREGYIVKIDGQDESIAKPIPGTMTMKLDNASGATYNNNTWTKHKVHLTLNDGSDLLSGHKETKYSVTYYSTLADFNAKTNGTVDNTQPNTLSRDGIYEITVTTEDNAGTEYGENGNKETREAYIVKIDGQDESIAKPTPGTITMKLDNASGATYNNDTWTKHKVHLTLNNGSDLLSGHKETKYSVTYYSTVADYEAKTNGTVNNAQPSTLSQDGIYEITVTTEDNAGTEYGEIGNTEIREGYIVKIDGQNESTAKPIVGTMTMKLDNASGATYNNDTWTKHKVHLTLNDGSDLLSGHKETKYSVTHYNSVANYNARTNGVVDNTEPNLLTVDGIYVITVTTEDDAGTEYGEVGNTSTSEEYIVKIDGQNESIAKPTPGTMTMKLDNASGATYNNDTWTKHKVHLTLNNGSDTLSGHKETKYSVTYYSTLADFNAKTNGTVDNTQPNTLSRDGIYEITVTTEDDAGTEYGEVGNTSTREYIIKIDGQNESIVKPVAGTITMKLDNASGATYNNDTWTKHKVYIQKVNGSDTLSGHKETKYSITYYSNLADYNAKINGTVNNTQPNTLSQDGIYEITVTTEDNAGTEYGEVGNTSTREGYIVKIDGQNPATANPTVGTLTMKLDNASGNTYNHNTWTKHSVYIQKVDGSDALSGHLKTSYSITYYSSVSRFNAGTPDSTNTSEPSLLTADGIYVITITTEDNAGTAYGEAGNKTTSEEIYIKIDKEAPTVGTLTMKLDNSSGTTYNNDTWTKHDVYIKLNNGSDLLSGHRTTIYTVKKNGVVYNSLEDKTSSTTYTLTETGVYTVTITTEDKAGEEYTETGNTSTSEYTIKIDKEAPTVGTLNMKLDNESGAAYSSDTWTKHDVYISVNSGSDAHSGHNKTTYTVNNITTGTGVAVGAGVAAVSSETITNANNGEYIDLGNNIVGTSATTDDWRILYVGDDGTVYAILADLLPNSTGYAAAAGLNTNGTYSVYSSTSRDTLLNGLRNTSYWGGLANGISGATVVGTPSGDMMEGNLKDEPYYIWDSGSTMVGDNWVLECDDYWISKEADIWAGGELQTSGVWSRDDGQTLAERSYYQSDVCGIRPVVALPAGTSVTKDGATWRVENTGGAGGVASGTTSEPTILTEEGIYQIVVTTEDKAGESYSEIGNTSTSAVNTYIVKIDKTDPAAIITGEATGVTDGLIRYFDANNNQGNGHSNSVTTWVDLAEKNNGTVTNGTFTNAYLSLNGTNSWVNMGTASIAAGNTTLEASIKLNAIDSTKRYILSNLTSSGGIGIYVQNGTINVEAYIGGTKKELKFDEKLDTDRIYNISVTHDGSNLKLYFDGVCQKTLAASGTLSSGTKLVLGANSAGNANFANIKVYSVRMYNKALTEAEIKQNLNADRISPEKLVASNSSVTVSIIFNEGIQNFTASDVTVTNGTKGTVSPVESSRMDDSGLYSEYTLPITGITAGSDLKIQLNTDSYSDKAQNIGDAPEITRTRDNVGPTVTSITASNIDYTNDGKDYTNNSSITYTIIFSEPTVGFVKEDLVIENGTLTTFTKVSSTEFTAVVTNTETAKQVLTVPAGVVTDDSGNLNAAASKEVIIDKTTPTITASVEASSNASAEDGKAVKEQSMTIKVEDKGTTAALTALQSGLKAGNSYQYYLSTSETALEGGEWKDYDQTGTTPFTIGTGKTGTYYLFVKEVKDNVDNVSIANGDISVLSGYHRFGPYVFDNSKPTISIPTNQQTTTNTAAEDGKAVTSQSVTITVADVGTAGVKTEAAGVTAENSMFAYYLSTSETALTGGEWTKYSSGTAFTLGTGKTGTYYLFIKTVKDNLGYESSEFVATTTVDGTTYHMCGPYVFDNANPIITLNPDKNETYERAQSVVAEVSDEGTAGLKATQVKYLWVQGTTTPTDSQVLAGTTFVNADTITKSTETGNDFYLWAIAKDNVGNTYKTSVGPFYLDNTKPTLGTITSQIESETTYMLNMTGFADTTGTTNQSGVKGYLISTTSTTPTTETAWGTVTATTTYDKWIPHTTDDLELEVPQDTTYYIWVIDNAGNISTQYSYTTKIIRYALNETSWYEKFEEVVNAATSGDTIRLLKSGTDNTGGTIDKNIIFNTDDKGLTRNVPITVNSGYTLEIQGGESGRITGNSTTQSTIIANGNVKLSGGTIESMAHSGIEATGTATITMTGGKVSSSVESKGAITNRGTGAITISGGIIGNYSNYIAISNLSSGNVSISGCTVNGSIYTGTGTTELKSGAIINGPVYGGSKEAAVATSNIVLKGATVNGNIYGGNPEYNVTTSNITLTSGGVQNVYGGALNGKNITTSNIKLQGASVTGNIYGGADTLGNVTTANITASSGSVAYIYGGSSQGGTTTNANITIQGSASISRDIYGGSEKAAFATSSNKGNITINIVGGGISGSVYGGSEEAVSYVNNANINIGKDATGNSSLPISNLIIRGSIYGGGSLADVTTYTTQSVTGTSNIKIDGTGYSTFTFNQHVFGSGKHCAVNTANISIKGVGAAGSPQGIKSIQRANTLTIDNSNLEITGISDVDNLNSEIAFTLNRIGKLTVKNGTTLHLRRGLNKVEEFNSLDGSGNKATVTIDANGAVTASNTNNRIYVYEGINFIIAKEQFVQGEKSSSYGKVSGMTFFGMYTRDRDTREIKYDLYDPISPTNGNLFKVGSYAEGLYDSTGAITVDGFYTNIMNADETAIISEYVTVETVAPIYQDWIVGLKTYTKEFTMVAKRNRDRVYQSVELDYLTEAGVTYNVSVFSINSLEPGVSLLDKTQIPVMASSGADANTKFALVMSNGATGWTTEGQTTFYTSTSTPIKGTTKYVTDDSGTAPLMDLYLYNSINIDKDTDCGIVEIVFLVEPSTGGQFRLALTINIQTLNEIEDDVDDEMAFQTETRITAGKNYDLFIEEKAYITDRSAMTVSFTIYPLGTFRTGDYRILSSTYRLPNGTKVTMIDYGQASNPKVYYQVINGYDAVEGGKYIYRLSNFKLMGATTAYNNPNSAYTTSGYEDYKFIFDFEDATISSDVLGESMQLEIRDGSTNNAKNQQLNTVEFNIYKNKNTTLTLQVTGDESNVYEMVAQGNLSFRIVSGVIRQKIVIDDEDVIINDTYFFDKKLGISVSIYDSSNNRVPYEKIKGTYFAVNGNYYYPDPTGLTRICISQSAATVAKDLNVYIGGGLLETGEYKLRIENFMSDNGTFYGLTAENRSNTTIKIIDLEHGLSAQIADEDRLIDNATGKTFSGTDNVMNIDIKASDIVDNTNIRMKLYRRDATFDGTGTESTYQAITYTHVNLQNYVSTTLTKPSDEGFTDKSSYEYLVTDEVAENTLIELALNLKTNLQTGGYKLVFELYSGDTSLGKIERHFLITDLVNVP